MLIVVRRVVQNREYMKVPNLMTQSWVESAEPSVIMGERSWRLSSGSVYDLSGWVEPAMHIRRESTRIFHSLVVHRHNGPSEIFDDQES